ncbi:hypothetical protein BDL97_04G039700 [Sphagnum fallax]|nr:hypothetical protein BDL97_04G039700 [Sphagnum fallax]
MEASLYECVCASLRVYMYRNATFLCERLCAEFPSENNLLLLATCYFRRNQAHRAYHVLKGAKSTQCRYLFALACFEMDSMGEAEAALLSCVESGSEAVNGAACQYMLGVICRLSDRRQAAIGFYTQALSLDPFFWSAYEDLCLLGADEDAATLYGDMAALHLQQQQQLHLEGRPQPAVAPSYVMDEFDSGYGLQALRTPYSSNGSPKHSRLPLAISDIGIASSGLSTSGFPTPSYSTPSPVQPQMSAAGPQAPGRNVQGLPPFGTGSSPGHSSGGAGDGMSRGGVGASGNPQQRRKFVDPDGKFRKIPGRLFEQPRRSTRLNTGGDGTSQQPCSTSGSGPLGQTGSASGSGVVPGLLAGSPGLVGRGGAANSLRMSISRKMTAGSTDGSDDGRRSVESLEVAGGEEGPSSSRRGSVDDDPHGVGIMFRGASRGSRAAEGAMELFSLLRILGEGFRHLCMFRCQEAMQAFSKLQQQQYETGWVLCQVGRAYFEMVDYPEAERAYSSARRVSPHHLEGTDMYSTALYHMKKDVELSYLAQETVAMDRLSPQAWCVMGNCFSLQKDHESALKFFQRALQLDSHFTYAHTLCGHEHVAMEDFEEGLTCYRNAIRMDPRHYNAWYGLGTIYFRQEKYKLAEFHFRRALHINSRSSVLHCYLGMALHTLKKNGEALELLEQAIVADPKNPLPKYQKANVLMSEERYHDALAELEQLKEVAPRESSVYFLMGKIYKRLDMLERAIYHFCIALDLKPSASDVNLIKTAIEKLPVADDLEDENL